MPIIYKYYCNAGCHFLIKSHGLPFMCLKLDGREEILPHPIENSRAKKLTGKNLDELFKEGRIIFKPNRICLECLQREKNCKCERPKLLEISKLKGATCPKCRKGKILKSLAGVS